MMEHFIRMFNLWLEPGAPCGTPENPEVLEEGQEPRPRRRGPSVLYRFPIALFLVTLMISLTLPSVFVVWANYWLLTTGFEVAPFLNWLIFLILAPVSYMILMATFFMNMGFLTFILALLRGKSMVFYRFSPMARRPRNAKMSRDVDPDHPAPRDPEEE